MKKIFLTLIAVLLSSQITSASLKIPDSLNTARWYKVYWTGIHIADLVAEVNDDSLDAKIESYGIVKTVSKYSSRTKTKFGYRNGEYVPLSYYTEFRQRHGDRKIDIKYTDEGQIAEEVVIPPENRAKRPAVDDILKQGTVDPLTAVMTARQMLKKNLALGQKTFSINVYDGRRLSRLDFEIHGRKVRKIQKKPYNIVKVTFKRHPVEGFTNNELRRMEGEEPLFTLYLSDDEYLLPIKADMEAPLGTAVLLLEKACDSMADCLK